MALLMTFSTSKFDYTRETPNDINPIYGESVLKWLAEKLVGTGYEASKPETEDWGWYVQVEGHGAKYMVGASGDPDRPAPDMDWVIQIHKRRTFKEKLTGANKLTRSDMFAALLERLARDEPDFRDFTVEEDAQ
jgi:hypothetical protein